MQIQTKTLGSSLPLIAAILISLSTLSVSALQIGGAL